MKSVVWQLESNKEKIASDDLNRYVALALPPYNDRHSKNYLRKIWEGESWESIKKKLETEGSTWYVWWMDGVHQHMTNHQKNVIESRRQAISFTFPHGKEVVE